MQAKDPYHGTAVLMMPPRTLMVVFSTRLLDFRIHSRSASAGRAQFATAVIGFAELSTHVDPAMDSLTDLRLLERLFKGDRSSIDQWIQLYLELAPVLFEQVRAAQEKGDGPALDRASHELLPQAHYLGAPRMLELLTAVSEGARVNGASACKATVEELLNLAEQVEEELRIVVGAA